jgi:hypothetical protein
MDPRERLGRPGGVECAACGTTVPADRIRVLASREDLAFVEIDCPGCSSASLGIIVGDAADTDVGPFRGEFLPADELRFRDAPPIDRHDVVAMRRLLDRHHGDVRALLGEA